MTLSGINITKHVKKNFDKLLYAPNVPRIALDSSSETFIFILAPIRNLFLLIISYIRPSTSMEPSFRLETCSSKAFPARRSLNRRKLVFFGDPIRQTLYNLFFRHWHDVSPLKLFLEAKASTQDLMTHHFRTLVYIPHIYT